MHSAAQFYVLRVLLGFAEGGLAPGIVLYLSQFATDRERAATFALPMLAIPLSIVIGSPLSGWLMSIRRRWICRLALDVDRRGAADRRFGHRSLVLFSGPAARGALAHDRERAGCSQAANPSAPGAANDWRILREPMIWASALLWFCLLSGAYGIMFWLPQMINQMSGLNPLQIGFVNALPWAGAMIGTYYNSRHSDRSGERFLHISVPAVISALAMLAAWSVGAGVPGLIMMFLAGLGLGAAQGAFWALPTSLLTPATFAVAAVAINVAGSSGGFVIPHLVGFVRERTGNFAAPILLIAGILLLAAALVTYIRRMFFRAAPAPRAP